MVAENQMSLEEYHLYNLPVNNKNPKNQVQGKQAHAAGNIFEDMLRCSCLHYLDQGIAHIEKTPEPMKPLRPLGFGKFEAVFISPAQADYKGVLKGGRCICFEAKHTDANTISQSKVTEDQKECLNNHERMGSLCFVVVSFKFQEYFRVPWAVWKDMKKIYGRLYVAPDEIREYQIPVSGAIMVLHNIDKIINNKAKALAEEQERLFKLFWDFYPRKVAKEDAMKAFRKLKANSELLDKIIAGLNAAKLSPQWVKSDGQFIPYASTWLNGRRWEDEAVTALAPENKKVTSYDIDNIKKRFRSLDEV